MAELPEDGAAPADPTVLAIYQGLRRLLRDTLPGVQEYYYRGVLNYGPSAVPAERRVYLAPQTKHVNLGFWYGTELLELHQRLEGTGKRMRHVKLRDLTELDDPALGDLLLAAWAMSPAPKR